MILYNSNTIATKPVYRYDFDTGMYTIHTVHVEYGCTAMVCILHANDFCGCPLLWNQLLSHYLYRQPCKR